MRVLDAAQMREADARGCERFGEVALMRSAGRAIAEAIRALAPEARRLVAFAGPGNNGGDAFAAFAEFGGEIERTVYALQAPSPSDARRDAEARAAAAGVRVAPFPGTLAQARAALDGADLALDALLGTGARWAPGAVFSVAIEALNLRELPVLAIDLPTGADATTGAIAATTVRAHATVTLGAPKLGLLIEPARTAAGTLLVGDIGIDSEIAAASGPLVFTLDRREARALFPRRAADADKRAAGAPLVIAGSTQFPGAAVLCARGAARAGAGYVTVATPADAASLLRAHLVEQVVVAWDEREIAASIDALLDLTNHASSVAIGPGLGLGDATGEIVRGFIARLELPFVVDASALYHLAKHLELLRGKRCVLTPHEREFARISGEGSLVPATRIERLRSFVARTGLTTLLKGASTEIDDGTTLHINASGSNALATAGSGDVLSGIIATLLGQGLAPIDAARLGAYWHGLAGRLAAVRRPVGVIAGDLPELLAEAYAGLTRTSQPQPGHISPLV
jgi:NAD(P)H-hydrate epimerase